ncbi:dynein regulatory complex protein 9-like [Sitophilus oryzae]|uniref:Dynein regulatory complex protein 9 n=1 Tax=Sitophilus oryzae TaxID=7048 RepID=A0A6J2XTY1_SITOR|nr:dynein regulatory complex protein 9-like [Sitophilus oryzae]
MNPINNDTIEKLSKKLLLCVLDENLDKLSILKNIYGWSEGEQTIIEYKSIEELYSSYEIQTSGLLSDTKEKIDLVDFQKDCSFIEATLKKTFQELKEHGTYTELTALVNIFKQLQTDEASFLLNTKSKEEEYIKLQSIYLNEKENFLTRIHETMVKIGELKDEIEDFVQESKIKEAYIKNWETAETELNDFTMKEKEEQINHKIKATQQNFAKESRVHQEVRNMFNEIEMDLQNEIKQWKIRYEHDLQIMEEKIKILKEKKEAQQEKTAEMIKKYFIRQKAIDDYNEHKIQQEMERQEKERKDRAATKIQAWWRGIMVRKGFGKYKKKKDKKGKKKANDKKK